MVQGNRYNALAISPRNSPEIPPCCIYSEPNTARDNCAFQWRFLHARQSKRSPSFSRNANSLSFASCVAAGSHRKKEETHPERHTGALAGAGGYRLARFVSRSRRRGHETQFAANKVY